MYLRELINELERHDPTKVVPLGFANPHSYRGYYNDLAFEPAHDVTIGSMLACAKSALGSTYEGYKGGDFKMGEWTTCWFASYGACGETIGHHLLRFMLDAARGGAS